MSNADSEVSVEITVDGDLAVIEVQRPPTNYFDIGVLRRIADAGQELADGGTRAIVLASQGKHFCAGADFGTGGLGAARAREAEQIYEAGQRIFTIPIPIVAAVQGSAVGGGLGLACAADFRVAAPSTRFHANFAQLGFHQGFGLSVTLPRIVGTQAAARLLLTAQRVTGEEAAALGLADVLVEDGTDRNASVRAGAVQLARALASHAPLAMRDMRATLRHGLADDVARVLEREIGLQVAHWQTEDCAEGVAATLERRPARFVGR